MRQRSARASVAACTATLLALGLALALGVASGVGSTFDTSTDLTTTAPVPTTTAPTTSTTEPTATQTTTTPTTTAPPPPAPSSATTLATTTAPITASVEAFAAHPGCIGTGLVAIAPPGRAPLLIGPAATPLAPRAAGQRLVYPADGSIVKAGAVRAQAAACAGGRPTTASTSLSSLSLFGGAIAAAAVDVAARTKPRGGWSIRSSLNGLTVVGGGGTLGDWGRLTSGPTATRVDGEWFESALTIHLLKRHGGLPAGTTIYLGYVYSDNAPSVSTGARTFATAHPKRPHARSRDARAHRKHAHRISRPLTVTPPLHGGPYVFPVVGPVAWGDTYGGPRSDVSGGWHHGDDIFAPLGRPVVAVAAGTVYLIGWERLGGWRIWLKDRADDRFYYAHLSGYSALVHNGGRVKAGQIIGFIGHTGDAFTTATHLHFEIHPVSLLPLHYDGAIDPSSYLAGWRHTTDPKLPPIAALPAGAAHHGEAAISDYRKLLAVRGITSPAAKTTAPAPGGWRTDSSESRASASPRSHDLVAAAAQSRSAGTGGGDHTLTLVASTLGAILLTTLLILRDKASAGIRHLRLARPRRPSNRL